MANIKSQMKRNRQNDTRYARNKSIRSELKTRERNTIVAAEAGDAEKAEELLRETQKRIDMATTKGVLHANTAARRKSRLTRRVRSILA
jgi:small subunit ribosomal protein S20